MFIGYLICASHFNGFLYSLMPSSDTVASPLYSCFQFLKTCLLSQNFYMCCILECTFPCGFLLTCTHSFFLIGSLLWTIRCSCQELSQHTEFGPLRHLPTLCCNCPLFVYIFYWITGWLKAACILSIITVPNAQQILSKYLLNPQALKRI